MNKGRIKQIKARQILDSRGNPTIEVDIYDELGIGGRGEVPSGASTGEYEATELRDGEKAYGGKGVMKSIELIHKEIAPALKGAYVQQQGHIDTLLINLDGTKNKSRIGANGILGTSMAVANAAANMYQIPLYQYIGGIFGNQLPMPMMNILNGGKHANNYLDFQEFMIMPIGARSFREALRMGTEIYHKLKNVLLAKGLSTGVGDEGGFAPEISSAREAFLLIQEAVKEAGYEPGKDIVYAMDAAASELYNPDGGCYYFDGETKARCKELCHGEKQELNIAVQSDTVCTRITRTTQEMIDLYEKLVEEFPIYSIEDALDQKDWEGWKNLTKRLGNRIQLVGDDLFVTNLERLKEGVKGGCGNAILIKPNQIGTVSETLETISFAKKHGYQVIISHRSGETEDTFIADLAVGVNAGQIKTGAPCRSDRVAKYNRLLRIEEELCEQGRQVSFGLLVHKLLH